MRARSTWLLLVVLCVVFGGIPAVQAADPVPQTPAPKVSSAAPATVQPFQPDTEAVSKARDVINERGTTIDRATTWGPIPLPKLPASATEAQKRVLQRWEAAAARALEDRKAASKALNERMSDRMAEAMRNSKGSGGFSVPYNEGDKPLRDAIDLATSRYKASIEAYLGTYEAASKGTELRYNDAGQITEIRYPTGGSAEMTWEGPNIRSLTLVEGDGSRTRIYPTGHRAREWRLDVGKGEGDPLAFTGRVNVLPNGTIERVPWDTKSQKSTLDPTGKTTSSFVKPVYFKLQSDVAGGLQVNVSQGNDGVKVSVYSHDAKTRSGVMFIPFSGIAQPKIVKEKDGVVFVSLDGTDKSHVAIATSSKPFGKGVAWAEKAVPYYDEKNLKVILKPLPSGTNSLEVKIVTARDTLRHEWIAPLPADSNYIVGPNWRAGTMGSHEGMSRMGWFRGNQFVADTTASARKFSHFVQTYAVEGVRNIPLAGNVVMAGEAIVGTEISGRDMHDRERLIHGGMAALGIALDVVPAAKGSLKGAKALHGVETTMGVTTPEAAALLKAASELKTEEQALLRLAATGKTVPTAQLDTIAIKLEKALDVAKAAKGGAGADEAAAKVLMGAERRVALPVIEPRCFVAGTQVVVAAREGLGTKAIEDVSPGDLVLAQDPALGALHLRPVLRTFARISPQLRMVTLQSSDGRMETLRTTDAHPFFVEGRGFVPAGALTEGAALRQADGSAAMLLSSWSEARPEGVRVYNFEVDEDHDYFVAATAGDAPVLVHNQCIDDILDAFAKTNAPEAIAARDGLAKLKGGADTAKLGEFLDNLAKGKFGADQAKAEAEALEALLAANRGEQIIVTPWSLARQADSEAAAALRAAVTGEGGKRPQQLYRIGTAAPTDPKTGAIGRGSEGVEGQFWSPENPLTTPGYAKKYGIPQSNIDKADFIEVGELAPGAPFVVRPAPPPAGQPHMAGGGLEVVTKPGGVQVNSFSHRKGDLKDLVAPPAPCNAPSAPP